ncbi:hypothetical protein GCM10023142_35980 [Anaerocolumna aminovalerica]
MCGGYVSGDGARGDSLSANEESLILQGFEPCFKIKCRCVLRENKKILYLPIIGGWEIFTF